MGRLNRHRLLLVILALWLPFQAVLAVAMPFCGHVRPVANVSTEGHYGHVHTGQSPSVTHHAHLDHDVLGDKHLGDSTVTQSLGACDQCGLCHLACAGFMAPSRQLTSLELPGHVMIGAISPAVTNPPLAPLDRPPLTTA